MRTPREISLLAAILCCAVALILSLGLLPTGANAAEEVVLYSGRHYGQEAAFEAFTQKTGIQIRTLNGETGQLFERLKAEGDKTPADVLITVDAGNLWNAARAGLLSPVASPELQKNIPVHLRDPENRWFGLTMRARTIMYNVAKVNPADLSTYEALGDPRWKGRICLRTSGYIYNQSLLATMIKRHGEAKTEENVRGWMANQPILINGDTKILEAIAAGQEPELPRRPVLGQSADDRNPRQRVGRRRDRARQEPRQRDRVSRVPLEHRGAADVRGHEPRVSGQSQGRGESDREGLGAVQAGRHQRRGRGRISGGGHATC